MPPRLAIDRSVDSNGISTSYEPENRPKSAVPDLVSSPTTGNSRKSLGNLPGIIYLFIEKVTVCHNIVDSPADREQVPEVVPLSHRMNSTKRPPHLSWCQTDTQHDVESGRNRSVSSAEERLVGHIMTKETLKASRQSGVSQLSPP
jgi:hypothetical protein